MRFKVCQGSMLGVMEVCCCWWKWGSFNELHQHPSLLAYSLQRIGWVSLPLFIPWLPLCAFSAQMQLTSFFFFFFSSLSCKRRGLHKEFGIWYLEKKVHSARRGTRGGKKEEGPLLSLLGGSCSLALLPQSHYPLQSSLQVPVPT